MSTSFFERPILNSPYEAPTWHHQLDSKGQPQNLPPVNKRRASEEITPVPQAKKRKAGTDSGAAPTLDFGAGTAGNQQRYDVHGLVNEVRGHMESWRALRNPHDWRVTPATARLLTHWRSYKFQNQTPFFCQIEAAETLIWLTEVARGEKKYKSIWDRLEAANKDANPEIFRLALKMATGSGKTTVMAMLIAWQTVNSVRSPGSDKFSRGFLIVAPGITIKDRLRVLLPEDTDNYYRTRELLPADMIPDIAKAKIVITNYHAFKLRETMEVSKTGRALLQGRGEPIKTLETDGQMLQRVCDELLRLDGKIVVINDEAHHCYREKPGKNVEGDLKGEDKKEAEKNKAAARLWISGIEALKRKAGVRAVYDLSATPFFLRGSGYEEGTLFPWVVSDFSLLDAIESGIVKLPRVPVADNALIPTDEMPVFRDLWTHVGKDLPKKGVGKAGELDPLKLPPKLLTALHSLYDHYVKTFDLWKKEGIGVPPVFIVVCQNTAISKLICEWISGWERTNEDGERYTVNPGHLQLFRNYDQHLQRLPKPSTLLIDSEQLESGEALDAEFRRYAAPEIEQFKRELLVRGTSQKEVDNISDHDLLREVMNTVGKAGRLGEQIRCVVSVSMLTEGWDTNTVTHILGVRAFGTQLLCEQVVGRALRRQSYDLNDDGFFDVEYADILGIPFDFTAEAVIAPPKAPKPTIRVSAVKGREKLMIAFPRVTGYRKDLADDEIVAHFNEDSRLRVTPELVGPCKTLLEGIVGEGVEIGPDNLQDMRPSTISYYLTKHLLTTRFRQSNEDFPVHLVYKVQPIVRRWIDEGYLICQGNTRPAMVTYLEIADQAAELIYAACQRSAGADKGIKAIIDPFNPRGSTSHVSFNTTKTDLWTTNAGRCQVNYVVCDSTWEGELARVVESHPKVIAYVKNQGLQFEVPYRDGSTQKKYLPDFIVQVDDGHGADDPLNLVVETKGYRGLDAQLKAETMRSLWVPGVNNLGTFGRWAFAEFTVGYEIESEFCKVIDAVVSQT